MSCRKTLPSFNSSRQMITAWKVSGLSHRPAIMASRPASIGDGDLTLPREQHHRSHLPQIHAHRIVRAPGGFLGPGLGRRLRRYRNDLTPFALLFVFPLRGLLARLLLVGLGLLGLDHVDTRLVKHRQNVLDLLRGHLLQVHDRVQLLYG